MADVLSSKQLKRLSEHKYSSQCSTILDPIMQIFWRWLVEQVPTWWAPNSITLTGFCINVFTAILLVWYSPDARQQPPAWTCILCAVGLFAYQSLDAIDGKQARRTNSSSPLGELFDHGCDAISTLFVTLSMCIALNLGVDPAWMLYQVYAAMGLFYVGHWQAYVSGTLKFGKVDVTEAQFAVMGIFIITAVFGSDFWSYKMPMVDLELKYIMCLSTTGIALIFTLIPTLKAIFVDGGIGRNGSTVAGTSVVFPMFSLLAIITIPVIIYQKSETSIYQHHPCLYLLAFGMSMSKITIKLIVAHMTKSELEFLDTIYIGPAMLFFNQYFNTILNEYIVLWMCLFYCVIDVLRYSTSVCCEICDYLHIYCFKIIEPQTNGAGAGATARVGNDQNTANTSRTRSGTGSKGKKSL